MGRLVGDAEPSVQAAALRVLRGYKMAYLAGSSGERLERLAEEASLRRELAAWPLAADVEGAPGDAERPGLLPLLISLLFPRLRKRSGRLGGKGAPGSARAAILNALAQLSPSELTPLLELFLAPLAELFRRPPSLPAAPAARRRPDRPVLDGRLLPESWWAPRLADGGATLWLDIVRPPSPLFHIP